MTIEPVDDELFSQQDDGVHLRGATCSGCATTTFPRQATCPRCPGGSMVDDVLPRRGTLWSWTVQHFPPPVPPYLGPRPFEPYGVGYVELGGRVIVEARLTEADPARLRIGAPVDLVLTPLTDDGDGVRATFAFAPVEQP